MLRDMSGRSPFRRILAIAFATLQLVSPALIVLVDGASIREAVAESVAHVESTTSESCPQVHTPDCALCRYLSACSASVSDVQGCTPGTSQAAQVSATIVLTRGATALLPDGRAPPVG